MRHRQRGMTFIGLVLILAMAGVLVYAGVRLTPVYLNYMNISHTMAAVATEMKGDAADDWAIRRALERHWEVEGISNIQSTDVQIEKGNDSVSLHVDYDDEVPFIGNVSLVAHFDKTVKIR